MKTFLLALFLCIEFLSTPFTADVKPKNGGFLLDPSKHYVYVRFDHMGDREPLSPDEPSKGLWLRLVNNCRIPITVAIFDTENGGPDPGVGVYDEVVSAPAKSSLPIIQYRFPGPARSRPEPAAPSTKDQPPQGYPLRDVFSTTAIAPGESLLFNLPLNHVGPTWGLDIRFYFELPGEGYGTGPYSVVSFDWQDIPEKFREPAPAPVSPKPTTR